MVREVLSDEGGGEGWMRKVVIRRGGGVEGLRVKGSERKRGSDGREGRREIEACVRA